MFDNNDGLPISEVSFDLHDNDINPNAWMVCIFIITFIFIYI